MSVLLAAAASAACEITTVQMPPVRVVDGFDAGTVLPPADAAMDALPEARMDAADADAPVTDAPVDAPGCEGGLSACAGTCVDLASNRAHCGACSRACAAAEVCMQGMCLPECLSPRSRCGTQCVSLDTDTRNCGTCGRSCNTGYLCASGVCVLDCGVSFARCIDAGATDGGVATEYCADLRTDPDNCGTCGNRCNLGSVCRTGACVPLCGGGQVLCSGTCHDLMQENVNCGACGNRCAGNEQCVSGMCVVQCSPPTVNCSGTCRTLAFDPEACGRCDNACPSGPNSTALCLSGACSLQCATGWANCDAVPGNGCERPLNTINDCGACDVPCALPNALTSCSTGSCTLTSCRTGYANCDNNRANGCEVDTRSDPRNCGTCGTVCGGTQVCANGVCTANCPSGQTECSGACRNLASDPSACGTCTTVCTQPANAAATCAVPMGMSTAACGFTCNSGYANCDNAAANGCETALNTTSNCRGCGIRCSFANASASCGSGGCAIASCNSGYANCDGSAGNGCEVSLSDPNNCGSCGRVCNLANANNGCSSSTCTIASCRSGWGNCDGVRSTGCETSLTTTTDCGACNTPCAPPNAVATCASGSCDYTACLPGWQNCDANRGNGCETQLNSLAHCGACNTPCAPAHALGSCSTGSCAIQQCNAGYEDCDLSAPNGCETPVDTLANCGGCGMRCNPAHASPTCAAGACTYTACDPGWADCDGIRANGCEVQLGTAANCASCGDACTLDHASSTCASARCEISTCSAGWGDCDFSPANGCETRLDSATHCGACGVRCTRAHGASSCATGACVLGACDPGFGDCDGDPATGCETGVTTTTHCGRCGVSCSYDHGVAACTAGMCELMACVSGYGDCDGNAANGCETRLDTTAHCLACDVACPTPAVGTVSCGGSGCAVSACPGTTADCNRAPADGCEVETATDPANCSACGITCPVSGAHRVAVCTGGACSMTCAPDFADCDGMSANGCEIGTATDPLHCGNCATACSAPNGTPGCSASACTVLACNANFANCDGMAANGCEVDMTTDASNCGGCGIACGAGRQCLGGVCLRLDAASQPMPTYAVSVASAVFVDACALGGTVVIAAGQNDVTVDLGVPNNFNVPVFGSNAPSFWASSNGVLGMSGHRNGSALPGALPIGAVTVGAVNDFRPAAFAFYDDLTTSTAGRVCYLLSGTSPARRVAVTWSGARFVSRAGIANFTVTVDELDAAIQFYYGALTGDAATGTGAVVGLQSANQNPMKFVEYLALGQPSANLLVSNLRIRFTPN